MSNLRLKLQRSLLLGLLVCGAPALAQNSVLLNEAAARSADARDAGSLLEEGDNAYLENDYKLAIDKYAEALSKLPKEAKSIVGMRTTAIQRFSQASLVQAQDLMKKGGVKNARVLVKDALIVDPDNPQLKSFLAKMDDPIRYESGLTTDHSENVSRVQSLLEEGQSYYNLGQFDRAYMTYEDILRIDRYNKAARRSHGKSEALSSLGEFPTPSFLMLRVNLSFKVIPWTRNLKRLLKRLSRVMRTRLLRPKKRETFSRNGPGKIVKAMLSSPLLRRSMGIRSSLG